MLEKQNSGRAGDDLHHGGLVQRDTRGSGRTRKHTKLRRVLAAFVAGKALNRFEAARANALLGVRHG